MTRYAIYFAPRPESAWWKAGSQWLGRDAFTGAELAQPAVPGLPHLLPAKLTSDARRYGFHATLKAPFRLQGGFTELHLLAMVEAFAAHQQALQVGDLAPGMLGGSLVLRSSGDTAAVESLAMRCVRYFDLLRGAQTPEEQERYRARGLSAREKELMLRWGYPYTEEQYRFHLTLTDSLATQDAAAVAALTEAARQHFARVLAGEALAIDGITVFREIEPGAPFHAWKRFPFRTKLREGGMPRAGRLIYVVGADQLPREALLQCLREHMPVDGEMVLARRTITRPAQGGDPHEPVDESTFWQLAQDGHFAMTWQADGLCYGVRRSIEVDLAIGRDVAVSGSIGHVPALRQRFPDALVVRLDAGAGGGPCAAEPALSGCDRR